MRKKKIKEEAEVERRRRRDCMSWHAPFYTTACEENHAICRSMPLSMLRHAKKIMQYAAT